MKIIHWVQNLFKKKHETLFWISFTTGNTNRYYFYHCEDKKTLLEFRDWIDDKHKGFIKTYGACNITDFKLLEK